MLIYRYNDSIGYNSHLISSGGALFSESHDCFFVKKKIKC